MVRTEQSRNDDDDNDNVGSVGGRHGGFGGFDDDDEDSNDSLDVDVSSSTKRSQPKLAKTPSAKAFDELLDLDEMSSAADIDEVSAREALAQADSLDRLVANGDKEIQELKEKCREDEIRQSEESHKRMIAREANEKEENERPEKKRKKANEVIEFNVRCGTSAKDSMKLSMSPDDPFQTLIEKIRNRKQLSSAASVSLNFDGDEISPGKTPRYYINTDDMESGDVIDAIIIRS
eukprot:g2320.t1